MVESRVRRVGCAVTTAAPILCPAISRADESGISLASGPVRQPRGCAGDAGWALGTIYHHTSVSAGNVAASRETRSAGLLRP
jgi:hypothetical protein